MPLARFCSQLTLVYSTSILLLASPMHAAWDVFRIPQTGGTEAIFDVNFIDDNEGWFLVGTSFDYEFYHTTNAAQDIVLESTSEIDVSDGFVGPRSRIHFRNPNLGYLLTNDLFNELLYRTVDGGKTFEILPNVPFERIYAMHLLPGDQMWIGGEINTTTAVLAYSANAGMTWATATTPILGFNVIELYFLDEQYGWVSGELGQMMYTQDGGETWGISRTGTTTEIKSIRFADPMKGWCIGADGLILVTKDGGRNWIRQISNTIEDLYALEVVDASRVFIAGGRSNFLFTEDGGANWFEESLPVRARLRSFQIQGNDLWVGGGGLSIRGDMYLFHRKLTGHPSPVIIKRTLPPGVRDVPYEDRPIEARFGTPPYTWSYLPGIGFSFPTGVSINPQTGALEGTPTNNGTFNLRVHVADMNGATDVAELVLTVARDPFAAGTNPLPVATHRRTYRSGIDFSGGNGPYDAQITEGGLPPGITLDPNLLLAGTPLEVGTFDFTLQVSDRSSPPQRVTFDLSMTVEPLEDPIWEVQQAHNRILDIHFFDDDEGIAIGWSGVILRTLDGGLSWNAERFGLQMIDFTWIGDEGWMTAEDQVFHSTDRGADWEELPHPLPAIEGIHFLDNQRGWIYGEGIAYTTNGGQTWDLATLPGPDFILGLDFAHPMIGFAGSGDGVMLKSTNGGATWTDVIVQGLNDGGKTEFDLAPVRWPQSPKGRTSVAEKGPQPLPQVGVVEFIDENTGWIGTNQFIQPHTSLFKTVDGGQNWTRQQVRGHGNVVNINFLPDGQRGWASMLFDAGLFRTTNGGATWLETNFEGGVGDVSFWAQFLSESGEGFVAYNSLGDREDLEGGDTLQTGQEGSIWKTTDSGASFNLVYGFPEQTNRVPTVNPLFSRAAGPDLNQIQFFDELNGFAVARETDGGTVARLKLYQTQNGGATWQFVSEPGVDREVLFVTPLHGWAIDQNVGTPIFETRDGGLSFVPREDISLDGTGGSLKSSEEKGIGQVEFSDIYFLDEQTGWIYINRKSNFFFASRLLRTVDGGATWQKIAEYSTGFRRKLHFKDLMNGYTYTEFGTIEETTDGGVTWTLAFDAMTGFPNPVFNDLRFTGSGVGWGVGSMGLAANLVPDATWAEVPFPETWTLFQTHFPDCSRGILVGAVDPVTGPPVLIDQADGVFSASSTIDTGLIYHDLRAVDFPSTESGWAYGGFGAGLKYCAPTYALAVATQSIPAGELGQPYSVQLASANATAPENWSLCLTDLPAGLALSPSGLLSGTPTEAGTFRFHLTLTDGSGQEAGRWFQFTTQPEVRPIIETASLPDGSVGSPYAAMLNAMGSIEPYDWLITEGSLPPGMNMIRCGLLGGTPTTPGLYSFRVIVLDAQNPAGSDEKELSIRILGNFVDSGEPCMGNFLFCLATNWKKTTGAGESDFDTDGDSDARDVIEALKGRHAP